MCPNDLLQKVYFLETLIYLLIYLGQHNPKVIIYDSPEPRLVFL